ncbi:MAG TPA: hypothetical protein VLZ83_12480 [Edaphocola sp.]|nr:hypothetical protein [Edaphocola sp.]
MQIRYKSALGIDPLADQGGQQVLSPYHAMGCNPALMVDPYGLQGQTGMLGYFDIYEDIRARFPTLHMHLPGGSLWGKGNFSSNSLKQQFEAVIIYNNLTDYILNGLGLENSRTVKNGYTTFWFPHNYSDPKWVLENHYDLQGQIVSLFRIKLKIGDYDYGSGMVYGQQENGGSGESWYSWNGPLMRYLVPDKFSIALRAELTGILGMGVQPINFSILTRGKEPGIYYTPSVNANLGGGAFFSAGIEFTSSCFTGDPRNITASMMPGDTYDIMANGGYLVDVSLSASFSPTDWSKREGFLNRSEGIGVGVFGGAQCQYTIGVIPLWQWKR